MENKDKLIGDLAILFSNIQEFNIRLQIGMSMLGKYLEVSRIIIIEDYSKPGSGLHIFEWTDQGVASDISQSKRNTRAGLFKDASKKIADSGYFSISETENLPEEEKNFLMLKGIQSFILNPVKIRNHNWGIIRFDDCKASRLWTEAEINIIQSSVLLFESYIERYFTERLIIEGDERFYNLYTNSSDSCFILDFEWNFIDMNIAAVDKFGYSKEELIEKGANEVILNKCIENLEKYIDQPSKTNYSIFDYAISRDGKIVPVQISAQILDYQRKEIVFITLKDITDRKETERHIVRAILETEERERKRFAKDLHDGLGPLLSSIKLFLKVVLKASEEEKRNKAIAQIHGIVDEAISGIKEIANNISPHVLNNFGLVAAIRSFCSKINEANAIHIDFQTNFTEQRFDKNIEIILFRVLEELIHNTIKHSQAKNAEINFQKTGNDITIIFLDDGIGFDFEKKIKEPGRGMGISNVLNRIESIKGKCRINTSLGKGLKIVIEVKV